MTSISEQLSAARQSQWQTQLDFLQAFGNRAIDSTQQLISLNLRATRTSVEQVTGTFKQLLDVTNPSEAIAVSSRAQGQWHYLLEFSRELLGIASGVTLQTWSTQPSAHAAPALPVAQVAQVAQVADVAPIAEAPAAAAQVVEDVAASAIETAETAADIVDNGSAAAYQASEQQAAQQAAQQAEQEAQERQNRAAAIIDTVIADDVPPMQPTALVQALNEVAPKPASAEHPIVSTVALEAAHEPIELPLVTPVEATPPVHVPASQSQSQPQSKGGRGGRARK